MDEISELNNRNYYFFSYTASLVTHIIILLVCFIYLKTGGSSNQGKEIDVQMVQGANLVSNSDDVIKEKTENQVDKEVADKTTTGEETNKNEPSVNNSEKLITSGSTSSIVTGYQNFEGTGTDTSGLEQVYAERTLNVKIKYPVGWTFVDQDRHSKLDGVTFWASNGIFNPPPYIFLEVKEKYLFNPSRYKFNTKLANSIAYYNDPEELEGQLSQVFYIRTESDEDYSIKLIMTGNDSFIAFQPIFFGMIKSFNFGKSLF
jgi:hypothetical protein